MVQAKATARYVRGSSQKARLVIDLIRGKRAELLRYREDVVYGRDDELVVPSLGKQVPPPLSA